jgi:hypothetical protein
MTKTRKPPVRRTKSIPTAVTPAEDAIARRAFELYVARGGEHGHHEEDWLRAESELRAVG